MRIRTRTIVGILAALLTSLFYIHLSEMFGRLQHDITFDDIGYVNDASDRISLLISNGAAAFWSSFISNPPHSPFSTVLAVAALAFGGYTDVVFYAANTIVLVTVVAFLLREFKNAESSAITWIVAAFLCTPLAYSTIENFRPDFAVGLSTAAMVWWFALGLFRRDAASYKLAGIAFAATLLIKPTFFAHTLAIAIGLVVLYLIVRLWCKFGASVWQPLDAKPITYFIAIGLLVAAPYYCVAGHQIFDYFWTNTRGDNAHLWSFSASMPISQVVSEYLFSFYQRAIGFHLYLSVAFIAAGAIYFLRTKKYADLMILITLTGFAVASFAMLVIGRHKNDFFFTSFQVLFLLAGLKCFAALYSATQPVNRRILLVVSWAVLLVVVQRNHSVAHVDLTSENRVDQSWNSRIVKAISSTLQKNQTGTPADFRPVKVFVTVAGPVNSHSVKWLATKQGIATEAVDLYFSNNVPDYLAIANQSAFVVVPNQLLADYDRSFPGASAIVQGALAKMLATSPKFRQLPASSDDHYIVFVNTDFVSIGAPVIDAPVLTSMEGFAHEEGPYPQWQLPRVQWMAADVGKLCVVEPGNYSVDLRFRADAPGTVMVAGASPVSANVASLHPGNFQDFSFAQKLTAESPCLTIKPAFAGPTHTGNQLLFSKLTLKQIGK